MSLLDRAREIAKKYGIDSVGACSLKSLSGYLPSRKAKHMPENGSVIVMLAPYYIGEYKDRNVAYYSMTDDYHDGFGEILTAVALELSELYPDEVFLPMTDASPIPEVQAALYAGLGVLGRHSMLLTEKYGSYVFIGEIVTSIDEDYKRHDIEYCIDCGMCQRVCPAGAITDKGLIADKCISCITQRKGELTAEEIELVKRGGKAWGCDICTEICPYNASPKISELDLAYRNLLPILTEEALDGGLEGKSYMWRGKKVLYRNLRIFSGGDDGVGGDS